MHVFERVCVCLRECACVCESAHEGLRVCVCLRECVCLSESGKGREAIEMKIAREAREKVRGS